MATLPRCGHLPNVYWQSLSMDELRREPRFEALPPAERVVLVGSQCQRYVRQEDELWARLHAGVLTTGRLAAALGLYERSAIKRLGLKSSRASHGQQLSAYRHLLCPSYEPETNPHISPEAAAAHNAAVVAAFQTELAAGPAAAPSVPAPTGAAVTAEPVQSAAVLTAAALIAEGAMSRPSSALSLGSALDASRTDEMTAADAGSMVAGELEAQDHAARGSGSGSSSGSRTRRRTAKKQAAVAAALAAADAAPGASYLLTKLAANGSSSNKKRTRRSGKKKGCGGSLPAADPVAQQQQQQRRQAPAMEQLESMKLRKARGLSQLGVAAVCCAWGKAQEAATLHAVLQLFPLCRLVEVGLCRLDSSGLPPDWGFAPGSLPPLGASPDALIRHRGLLLRSSSSGGSISGSGSGARGGMEEAGLVQRLGGLALGIDPGSSGASGSSAALALQEQQQWVEEVVEVKNSCPFGLEARPRGGQRYQVRDRGPRPMMAPEWVPQLQLHMLCAGTASGLLVSRSATKGVRVFRLWRDDAYLRIMLTVVSRLWTAHVGKTVAPAADCWASWSEHHALLSRTAALAAGAELVVAASGEALAAASGADERAFLD